MEVPLLHAGSRTRLQGLALSLGNHCVLIAFPMLFDSLEEPEVALCIHSFITREYFFVANASEVRYKYYYHPMYEYTHHSHRSRFLSKAKPFFRLTSCLLALDNEVCLVYDDCIGLYAKRVFC